MSLRKIAALLAVFGLIVGTIGSGVGASFFDHVTAQENIAVGTFSCQITSSDGTVASDHKSVTYNAPTINSSAPGSAPFSFTVQNNGSINQVLTVAMTGQSGNLGGNFSAMPATPSPVALAAGASQLFTTGIQWTALTNDDLARSGSMTWTVNCGETQTVRSAGLQYGPNGWGGWSCPAGTQVVSASIEGGDLASLTLWRPGASVTDAVSPFTITTYPSTPTGYTYGAGEQGAIGQNDNDSGETIVIVLQCTL